MRKSILIAKTASPKDTGRWTFKACCVDKRQMKDDRASQQRRMEKAAVHPRANADTVASVPPIRTGAPFPACCCPTPDTHPLIDHQLQIRGWLTIRDHHGNAELLLYERCKEWLCFTPSHSGNEGQPSFNYYLWWFKYSLKASDFFKCSRLS